VPRESSSGNRVQRGAITKTGNAHLRRVLVKRRGSYQHRPNVQASAEKAEIPGPQRGAKRIAWKAQRGCTNVHHAGASRQEPQSNRDGPLARELLGFVWAIAVHTEAQFQQPRPA